MNEREQVIARVNIELRAGIRILRRNILSSKSIRDPITRNYEIMKANVSIATLKQIRVRINKALNKLVEEQETKQ